MIDITVDNNSVEVEGKIHRDFNNRDELVNLLTDVIERTKYSGETISLWRIRMGKKEFVKEWH